MSLATQVVDLATRNGTLSAAERGLLNVLLDRHLNVESPAQVARFLYGKGGNALSARIPASCSFKGTGSDLDAILSLHRKEQGWVCMGNPATGYDACNTRNPAGRKTCVICKAHRGDEPLSPDPRLSALLRLRWLLSTREKARCKVQRDGRLRFSINLASGPDFAHATYPLALRGNERVGLSPHAMPDAMWPLLKADEGFRLGTVRLESPALWTIACEMAVCGDEDLLSWLRRGYGESGEVLRLTCYGWNPNIIARHILEDSYNTTGTPLFVSVEGIRELQAGFHSRYPGIHNRAAWIKMKLNRDGFLTSSAGCRRVFFARKSDPATEREALAWNPRVMETYVPELAWARCWGDPENWPSGLVGEGDQLVQPLAVVRDRMLCQWPAERHEWALAKWKEWLANPVTIAGTVVTVPAQVKEGL